MTPEKLACYFGIIYNNYNSILIGLIILYLCRNKKLGDNFTENTSVKSFNLFSNVINNFIKIGSVSIILSIVIEILKKIFKSIRPCSKLEYTSNDCCPKSYDIPSGHSAYGVFHGLLLLKGGYPFLGYLLMSMPIARYIGKQHSLAAVLIGSLLGYYAYDTINTF
jgi:hypothetical protein